MAELQYRIDTCVFVEMGLLMARKLLIFGRFVTLPDSSLRLCDTVVIKSWSPDFLTA